MKLHIDRLHIELRGDIGAEVAQDAIARLGPALADALRAGPATAVGADLQGAAPLHAATLARQLAGQLALQLRPHLAPQVTPHVSQHVSSQPSPRRSPSAPAHGAAPDKTQRGAH